MGKSAIAAGHTEVYLQGRLRRGTHLGMKSTPASLMVAQLAARVSLATFCSSSAELLSAQYDSTAFLISRLPPCVRMCVYARLSVSL